MRPATSPSAAPARLATFLGATTLILCAAATPAGATLPGVPGAIAYTATSAGAAAHVLRTGPSVTSETTVATGSSPAWSPDGTALALVQDGRLVIAQADGSSVRTVPVAGATDLAGPQWSPDGRELVFSGRAGGAGQPDVLVAPVDGGGALRDLTPTPGVAESDPTWSPDGATIYFSAAVVEGGFATTLGSVSTDGSGARMLAGTDGAAGSDVSPDGRFVVFATPGGLRALDRRSGASQILPGGPGVADPAFSPDCSQVTYTRTTGPAAGLESLTFATGTVVTVAAGLPSRGEVAWQRLPGASPTCTLVPPVPPRSAPLSDGVSAAPRPPAPAAPQDVTPPTLSIGATGKRLSLARRHGLRVAYRVGERVRLRADVMLMSEVSAPGLLYATAPAAGPGRSLASADLTRAASGRGEDAIRIQFNYRALKVLRPFLRLTVNLRLIATDAAGNETTAYRRVILRNPY